MNKRAEKKGVLGDLNKNLLVVDKAYQRNESPKLVKAIAKNWKWTAAGVITVNKRDGVYNVIDGQHRVLAAKELAEVTHLPCIIHDGLTIEQEAETFLDVNVGRNNMSALDKFRAATVKGDELAIYVNNQIEARKFMAAPKGANSVQCVKVLCDYAKTNRANFVQALDLSTRICKGRKLDRIIFDAIGHFYSKGVVCDRIKQRILDLGYDAIYAAIKKANLQFGSRHRQSSARGLLEAVNKGLRNKFEVEI